MSTATECSRFLNGRKTRAALRLDPPLVFTQNLLILILVVVVAVISLAIAITIVIDIVIVIARSFKRMDRNGMTLRCIYAQRSRRPRLGSGW